jgi:hypothetical protein
VIRKSALAIVGTMLVATPGLAAWIGASNETCAGVSLLTTGGVLILATVGAVCRRSHDRPRFVGFAVFGWGYCALARWYTCRQGPMPTVCWLPGAGDIHNDLLALPPAVRIAHDAWSLAFAVLGSILAGLLVKHSLSREPEDANLASESADPAGWWRGPAFAGLLAFGLVAVAAMLATGRWEPESCAGAAFLLTWALLCLAILGAVCARGRRSEGWIGSATFGVGYLILAFGQVVSMELPTNHLLNAVFRPGGPTTVRTLPGDDLTTDDESRRVRLALQEPIDVHFPEGTSLQVVLGHIKKAIRASSGKDLVLFGNPEPTFRDRLEFDQRVVTIDRADIPAEDALRLCLGQLGMTCGVQSGYVRIVRDAYEPLPFAEDPVMIGGHSLLALFAAAMGGAGAVLVAGLLGRHSAMARHSQDVRPSPRLKPAENPKSLEGV